MSKKRQMRIGFPLGGLDRRAAYRQQRPFTTPDCLNVRPAGVLEGRKRGGSRPGYMKSHTDDLGTQVRLLYPMALTLGDSSVSWSDTFAGSAMADEFTQASWVSAAPSIVSSMASAELSDGATAVVRDVQPIDTTYVYFAEMLLVPYNGAFHGNYRLYLRLDDTTPAIATDGVVIDLTMTGAVGAYSGTMTAYESGASTATSLTSGALPGAVAKPVWLSVEVGASGGGNANKMRVTLEGATILDWTSVGTQSGLRVGFGLEDTVTDGRALCDVFRVQYFSTGEVTPLRTILVASASGDIRRETRHGRLSTVTTDLTLRSDKSLTAAQSGQKLYIADYGNVRASGDDGVISGSTLDSDSFSDWTTLGILTDDDVVVISNGTGDVTDQTYEISSVASGVVTLASAPGDGNCTFIIERAPKVYDPLAATLSIMTATDGQVPNGSPLTCRFNDRIFLGGAESAPHVWYAARQGDELDWDYSQTDSQRAVSGVLSDAGTPGDALTAFAPHSDDFLIMGCRHELWRMRGDPAFETTLGALSRTVGIVGQNAWCLGPSGELIFLSMDGIYILPPGGESQPISISRESLPEELLNFDPDTTNVCLEYDVTDRGVHIYLTPESTNARTHWWLDWEAKTFWPITIPGGHEPTTTCTLQSTAIEESGVILGGRDGVCRRASRHAETDDGTAFASYASIGPIPLAKDSQVGILMSMDAEIAENSGDVTWSVRPALTFEAAVGASSFATGAWVAGLNSTVHPGGRGQAYMLRITGTGRKWAFEMVSTQVREAGRRRIA